MSLRDAGEHEIVAVTGKDLVCRCGWPLPDGVILTVDVPVMLAKAYLLYHCPSCHVGLQHELSID